MPPLGAEGASISRYISSIDGPEKRLTSTARVKTVEPSLICSLSIPSITQGHCTEFPISAATIVAETSNYENDMHCSVASLGAVALARSTTLALASNLRRGAARLEADGVMAPWRHAWCPGTSTLFLCGKKHGVVCVGRSPSAGGARTRVFEGFGIVLKLRGRSTAFAVFGMCPRCRWQFCRPGGFVVRRAHRVLLRENTSCSRKRTLWSRRRSPHRVSLLVRFRAQLET
ncbi:hypothetical protein PLICRDRAFT_605563 [Plicaturopsis crispa FD-325 SS-3]|nr:hypothetical protein PLICRDRAFT_605563 [Plicaturopsis crispa FD-325 SS-3]